jgi:acetyl esterase/lipase
MPPTFGQIPVPVTTQSGLTRLDVSYLIEGGYRPLELELYLPKSESPSPVIVWIHGGGYAGGSRKEEAPWIEKSDYVEKAVQRGFAVARIDYRLGFEASFPAAVNDGHAALRWLGKFANQLNLDASRIFFWGSSAGAHLAGLVINTFDDPFFEGTNGAEKSPDLKVAGFVNWYGAMELNTIVRPMDGTDESIPELFRFPPEYFNLGSARWKDQEWLEKASPVTYISEKTPPTLIVHGDADTMVPIQQAKVLQEKLELFKVPHEFVVVEGGNHAWMGLPQQQIDALVDQALDFMEQCPREVA